MPDEEAADPPPPEEAPDDSESGPQAAAPSEETQSEVRQNAESDSPEAAGSSDEPKPKAPDDSEPVPEAPTSPDAPKSEATAPVSLAQVPKAAPAPAAKEPPSPPPKSANDDTARFARQPFASEQVEDVRSGIPAFRVDRSALLDALTFAKDKMGFDYLACITAIDWTDDFEVVYNLWSYEHNRPFAVRVKCPRDDPIVPSVVSLWEGANWLEREEFDLMGIEFEGNADLRRILLPEGWQGHPLRKDYDWKKEQYVGMDEHGLDVVYDEPREDAW